PGFWALTARYWYQYASLFAIIAFLIAGFSTITAVFWSIIVAIAVSYIRRETALGPAKLVKALAAGTKQVLPVGATTAVAGIAVGILLQTGLGLKISSLILALGFGNLVATLVVSGIVLWVLGLSLPITATYLVAVPTVVPALITLHVPPTNLVERGLLIVGGVLLVAPGLLADVAGILLFAAAALSQFVRRYRATATAAA